MQGSRKKQQRPRKLSTSPRSRVVDMQSFRKKRRKESWKVIYKGYRSILYWLACALFVVSLFLGVGGFVPTPWRAQFILWAFLLATVGFVLALWLSVVADRRAVRILRLLCICYLVAYVAGVVKAGF